MDRSLFLIALLFTVGSSGIIAQEAPKPEPSPSASASPSASPRIPDRIRQSMEKLPEEQRTKFLDNFRHWQQMSEEEKAHFRDRAVREKQKIHRAVNEALKKTGLTLPPEKREVFALRYMQERKKIEQELRAEMQAKRDKLLEGVFEMLKAEFGADSKPAASPTP